jgi:hypothetical protein
MRRHEIARCGYHADVDPLGVLFVCVIGPQFRLLLLSALHGVHDWGEVH